MSNLTGRRVGESTTIVIADVRTLLRSSAMTSPQCMSGAYTSTRINAVSMLDRKFHTDRSLERAH